MLFRLKYSLSMRRLYLISNVVKLITTLDDPIPGQHIAPPPNPIFVDCQVQFIPRGKSPQNWLGNA